MISRTRVFGIFLLASALSSVWAQTTWFVRIDGDDAASGLNWEEAVASLSNALARATNGDTILVSNGLYVVNAEIVVNKTVSLIGLGGAENTILAGGFPASTNRILNISAAGAIVDGFTISNGYLNTSAAGAGLSMSAGLVRNCRIVRNRCNYASTNVGQGSGGGVHMSGGVISNCVIEGNATTNRAGGVYMTGGTIVESQIENNVALYTGRGQGGGIYLNGAAARVERCRIGGNQATLNGGGIYLAAGGVFSSLIVSNTTAHGGGIFQAAGVIVSSTIADNVATNNGGGLVLNGGALTNGIVWGNTATGAGGTNDLAFKAGTVVYTCSGDPVSGTGNITNNPQFIGSGNYRLAYGSPCIDTGTSVPVLLDLDGRPRPLPGYALPPSAMHDMGAYEAYLIDEGPLRFDFTADNVRVVENRPLRFTTLIAGGDTNDLYFIWDFETTTGEGFNLGVVSNAFSLPEGSNRVFYTVSLIVSNASGWATVTKTNYIEVGAAVHYVAPDGHHVFPFRSWSDAATNIQSAIDAALDTQDEWGPLIRVADGSYPIRRELTVEKSVQLRSENGASSTVIYRPAVSTNRLVVLSNQFAVVSGFTLTNGFVWAQNAAGGGVRLYAGSLLHCVVQSNRVYANGSGHKVFGGGVYLSGGLISNCTIRFNWADPLPAYAGRPDGGGVYMTGGRIVNSFITDNYAAGGVTHPYGGTGDGIGGGIAMTSGELLNTVVARNWTHAEGGGVHMTGGRMIHCTVAFNRTRLTNSAGLFLGGGAVSNSIIYYNSRYCDDAHVNIRQTGGTIAYSCTWPLAAGTGNISSEPDWTNPDANDFALLPGSPCIDAAAWLANLATDGAENPRSLDGNGDSIALPDMGAFESQPMDSGPLRCNFLTATNESVDALGVNLIPIVAGAQTNITLLQWDWNGDGTVDSNDFALNPYPATYEAGIYSPALFVSNSVGETVYLQKPKYIRVFPSAVFVATNGAAIFPYNSWAKATPNLYSAIVAVADGGTITLHNGTFVISNSPPLVLAKGIEVKSLNGPGFTILRGGRRIEVVHSNAALRGVTVTFSRGIQLSQGVVSDCIITNCQNTRNISVAPTTGVYPSQGGGGILMSGGLVERCIVASNIAYNTANGSADGGGVYMTGGTISNTLIIGNIAYTAAGYAGNSKGGGVFLGGPGRLVNCTVVRNMIQKANGTATYGGGIYRSHAGSTIENGIIRYNLGVSDIEDIYSTVPETGISYSCSPGLVHNPEGTGNITNDPLFVVIGEGFGLTNRYTDCHLTLSSPCRNSGSLDPALVTTFDLEGRPRVLSGRVDMGCYELPPQKGTFILIR